MTIDAQKPDVPLSDVVYAQVRDLLREGELAPGQRLSESELCERFQVSRTPAREAIHRLINEGFLAVSGSGRPCVAEIDINAAEEIYDMREAVECLAARLAAKKATTEDLIELRAILDEQRRGVSTETEFLPINDRFHGCIYRISGNRYVQRTASILLVSAGMIRGTTHGKYDFETFSLKEHEEIYQAIEDGDSAAAEAAMRRHTRHGRFQRIALLTRTHN
ncbi:GntR family transcriptional regulator [Salipiger sp. PrR003]|uniref:GntR family transcriptional regulator n=1 Tax=Salipiger sp. PrR003 TaxID=2706776 RepID=UPI0013DD6919|nr:GntR family transcriptional regulator [Salipiger sp. PrR003]NDV52705.1 GntR family transcriptional regulator [Salipiger sp. PrR003]